MTQGNNNAPKLRFFEFNEEWKQCKLGKIVTFQRGFDLPAKEREKGSVPIVSSSGVSGYHSEAKVCPPGLVTGRYGSIGNLFFIEEPFWPLNTSLWVKNFHKNLPKFTYYHLSRFNFKIFSDKTGVPGVNRNDLHTIRTSLPSLPEQQKIADFLTTIDTRLRQLREKAEHLRTYKKGVMQQLFSQQIRFKAEDGGDFADWEYPQFGKIFTFFRTNSFSRSLLNYERGNIRNIHYGDIHTKFNVNFDLSKEDVPYVNEDIDLSLVKEEDFCQKGDLVIADASEDYKDIGKAIEIVNLDNQKLISGLHTYIARDLKNRTIVGFKGYMMQSHEVRIQMMKMATGISVLGLSKTNIAKVTIPLPSLPEQQKIADFLTALDERIQSLEAQIEQTEAFKRGLLQQMFV